jgi:hypothetical protein
MTILKRKPSESGLERLEREGNDDFLLLEELGPRHFGFEHLLELREQIRERLQIFQRRQRLAMIIGACSSGWIFLAIMARHFDYMWLALAAYSAGALSLIAFLGIVVWQKKQFESKGELEYTRQVIEEELRRRAGKMPQQPRKP